MKKLSMLTAAVAIVLSAIGPAQALTPGRDYTVTPAGMLPSGSSRGCTGPLTFETLKVTTDWASKPLVAGGKARVAVSVTRGGTQAAAEGDSVGAQLGGPVAGARVVTVIYFSRGYRWVVGETDEEGRATFSLPLPKKAGKALAATATDFSVGPRMDCGATEVGYAEDELSIRRQASRGTN